MTMHVNLSPEMEGFIKAKVGSGFYGNATEVIRDAIRRMQADEEHAAAFRAAVAKGEAEIERGESDDYTPALMDRLMKTGLDAAASKRPIDPDVLP